ncbi:P-loop containing nucleoside triphosphatehydrolases superfamily protein [Striga asiatica]|uniref:P-loop containing nucleoside triphosphatehydrolases superfamily protein n=1 Tax=Striga asiatica TaxID=4170 RepID=A0A5A7Q4Z8_STRAF|nr:P-loop containing nucleoside triphosphatehydrolases superfamily protein [Striga asiatica]
MQGELQAHLQPPQNLFPDNPNPNPPPLHHLPRPKPHRRPPYQKIQFLNNLGQAAYLTLHLLYFILTLLFSLLSTSAVIYTVACTYASPSRDLSFPEITCAVPRVWTRLAATFVRALAAYNIIFGLFFYMSWGDIGPLVVVSVVYMTGFVHLMAVCQLAGVVSVLEEKRGCGAMGKGMG